MKKLKILFFGRKNDYYSMKCLEHLNNLNFDISVIWSNKRGEKLKRISDSDLDYILCHRSYFILPDTLLKLPRHYSINFHPAPPSYPGSGGLNFALYNNDEKFGITIHLMNRRVDDGDIILTKNLKIEPKDNLDSLLKKTHELLLKSFIEFTNTLKADGHKYVKEMATKNKDVTWSKKKTKISEVDNFQEINRNISKTELQKRVRAFHTSSHPLRIKIHSEKFIMKK
ncbi:MAG: formyltransferase family protein [Alphaproteobacteria bacterium]